MNIEKTSELTKRLIDGNKEPSKSWWMDEGYMPKENPKLEFCKRMETYKSSEINPKMDKFKDITSLEELCDLVIIDIKNETIEVPEHLSNVDYPYMDTFYSYLDKNFKDKCEGIDIAQCAHIVVDIVKEIFICLVSNVSVPASSIEIGDSISVKLLDGNTTATGIAHNKYVLLTLVPKKYYRDIVNSQNEFSMREMILQRRQAFNDNIKIESDAYSEKVEKILICACQLGRAAGEIGKHVGEFKNELLKAFGDNESYDDYKPTSIDANHKPSTKPIDIMNAGRTKKKHWQR